MNDVYTRKRREGDEFFQEEIADNFPNLGKEQDIQAQEADRFLIFPISKGFL